MSSSYYRQQLESYLGTLNIQGELVIDVGGKQKSIQGRTKVWNVKELRCLDIPEYDLNVPQEMTAQADWVFCLEVFEYLIVPTVAMQNIAKLMKPGAKAVVSFAFVYPLHNEIEFDSLRYTETAVKRLASYADLTIEKITKRRPKTNTLTKYYSEDGMRAVKGYDHSVTGFIVEFRK